MFCRSLGCRANGAVLRTHTDQLTHPLLVTMAGSGIGSVTRCHPGVLCASDCAEYSHGTAVTLTATAATGSIFAGWGGACGGAAKCLVTMDAVRQVTATFVAAPIYLPWLITIGNGGSGTETSSVASPECGDDCADADHQGTVSTAAAVSLWQRRNHY